MNIQPTVDNPIMEFIKYGPVTLHTPMSIAEFYTFQANFPELQMEREKNGKVIIMSPVKKGSGKRESLLQVIVGMWALNSGLGEVYSPSTGIELPDASVRSPDLAWVSDEKLANLPDSSDEEFLAIVPDFIIELASSSDRISSLKEKMEKTWMKHGVRLGWLIDPYSQKVWMYRKDREVEVLEGFEGKKLTGESVMPGLEFPLDKMIA